MIKVFISLRRSKIFYKLLYLTFSFFTFSLIYSQETQNSSQNLTILECETLATTIDNLFLPSNNKEQTLWEALTLVSKIYSIANEITSQDKKFFEYIFLELARFINTQETDNHKILNALIKFYKVPLLDSIKCKFFITIVIETLKEKSKNTPDIKTLSLNIHKKLANIAQKFQETNPATDKIQKNKKRSYKKYLLLLLLLFGVTITFTFIYNFTHQKQKDSFEKEYEKYAQQMELYSSQIELLTKDYNALNEKLSESVSKCERTAQETEQHIEIFKNALRTYIETSGKIFDDIDKDVARYVEESKKIQESIEAPGIVEQLISHLSWGGISKLLDFMGQATQTGVSLMGIFCKAAPLFSPSGFTKDSDSFGRDLEERLARLKEST
jgi:hypothetical protein